MNKKIGQGNGAKSKTPLRDALPLRQRLTFDTLLTGVTQVDAYRAGFGPRALDTSVKANASRLIASDRFQAAIHEAEAVRHDDYRKTADWLLEHLRDEVETLNPDSGANRIRAADLLGRNLRLFGDAKVDDGPQVDTTPVRELTLGQLLDARALLAASGEDQAPAVVVHEPDEDVGALEGDDGG